MDKKIVAKYDNNSTENTFFSIIIPTHNSAIFLNNLLDSIINQTFKNFELIIVDDNSTDNTVDLIVDKLKNIKDFNYNVVKTDVNIKAGPARNIGIELSVGKYILFIDSDDEIDKNLLINIYTYLRNDNYNIDLLIFGFVEKYIKNEKTIFSKNVLYDDIYVFNDNHKYIDIKSFNDNIDKFEKNTSLGYLWNKCYKRSIVVDNNVNLSDSILYEDLFFNLEYLRHTKNILLVNYLYYTYNNYVDNKSITKSNDFDYYNLSNKKLDVLKQYFIDNNILNDKNNKLLNVLSDRYRMSYIVRQFENNNYLLKNLKLDYKIGIIDYIKCFMVYIIKKYFYSLYLNLAK